jgi:glycosyltransferase involved in cell wall biosynthesis
MEKVRVFWCVSVKEAGNTQGYFNHATTLKAYLDKRSDIEFVRNPDDGDVLFLLTTPEFVTQRLPHKRIVLFTMFEGLDLPESYKNNLKNVDYLMVPSTWVKEVFSQYFDSDKIFVVPEGAEPLFRFHHRKAYPNIFRFLWVGAPNPRKGYQEIITIWDKSGLINHPKLELYLKTTNIPNIEIKKMKNIVLDNRKLPAEQNKKMMAQVYYNAHCFVQPTRGEGWNLVLTEAMATGLPSIATGFSGHMDFFDKTVGYPVAYEIKKGKIISPALGDLGEVQMAYPDMNDVLIKMHYVWANYKEALEIGRKASIRIKTRFTWELAAEKFVGAMEKIVGA